MKLFMFICMFILSANAEAKNCVATLPEINTQHHAPCNIGNFKADVIYNLGKYTGETRNEIPHGFGLIKYNNGNSYTGNFENGWARGFGIMYYENKDIYVGWFLNNNPNGMGIYIFRDNQVYEGEFENGKLKDGGYRKLYTDNIISIKDKNNKIEILQDSDGTFSLNAHGGHIKLSGGRIGDIAAKLAAPIDTSHFILKDAHENLIKKINESKDAIIKSTKDSLNNSTNKIKSQQKTMGRVILVSIMLVLIALIISYVHSYQANNKKSKINCENTYLKNRNVYLEDRNSKLENLNQNLVNALKQADTTIKNLGNQKEKKKSPYEILNIKIGASHDEIKTARNKLVKENHPDKISHMGPEIKAFAEQRIKDINTAYEMLTKGKV